ncbi:hypothetical protein ACFSTE_08930 [Aquimarina hainanensis]|uniref:Uncharacterized protein n=1 Tax=Aquimarina hainanensis TaxID=1578017 RepID=A0ABW5N7D8_9FLAO|nr:hypothetical protein [Aquimarina sp. TRL1]QKX03887.1 hypothetical protein HN014_02855 [Aquimarina sp. TRL1]
MMKEKPTPELKKILSKRKERFRHCRIGNGIVTRVDLEFLSETIDTKSEAQIQDSTTEEIAQEKHKRTSNNVEAVKTYIDKMKGGYFGRRKSRF